MVLDRLLGHEGHLTELHILRHNLFIFLELLLAVQPEDVSESAAEGSTREVNSDSVVESLGDGFVGPENGEVVWLTFNTLCPTALVSSPLPVFLLLPRHGDALTLCSYICSTASRA